MKAICSATFSSGRLIRSALFYAALGGSLLVQNTQAALRHRYAFNEQYGTTTVQDSIGNAHGTVHGSAYVMDGAVYMDGSPGGYVELPAGLITGYSALTFEAWASFGSNGNWSRLYDFGDMNASGQGRYYVMFTPHSGSGDTRVSIAAADPGYDNEYVTIRPGVLDGLGVLHIVAVYEPSRNYCAMYIDGKLVAVRHDVPLTLSSIQNVYSFLGRSLYAPDAWMNGSILEFRIYDHALSAPEVAASFAAGPENPTLDPGPLQSISLGLDPATVSLNGMAQCIVLANFAKVPDVDVSDEPDVTITSSDETRAIVQGRNTVRGVSLGTATIRASYRGKQASQVLTIIEAPARLKHRYSFNEALGEYMATDSVGGANGVLQGGALFNGDGQVVLDGVNGYVDLPNGIISALTNATFEVWTTWTGGAMWERIFDFGNNVNGEDGQGTGTTYLLFTPRGGAERARFSITIGGGGSAEQITDCPSLFPKNTPTHLVVTYSYSERTVRIYMNGLLVSTGSVSIPLKSITDVNNWLGKSNWPDPYYSGLIDEFRIYEGTLTPVEIALNAAVGPNKLLTGTAGEVKNLTLQLPTTMVLGAAVQATALADFATVSGVNVTTLPSVLYSSSNPNVVKINATGRTEAIALGSAVLTVSFQGKSASVPVTVTEPAGVPVKPILIHRYSFNEPQGETTVRDSVGGAHGQLVGRGGFTGDGKLDLPGGAANSDAGFVDLPNGIISNLTNLTVEAWVTWRGPAASYWQRIFDFGNNTQGENGRGTGTRYLFLTPRGGASVTRFGCLLYTS
ncbi:MAG: hypothetical protein N3G20_08710, partial [Verrucomicrobiae bacterium]|nr:hypothetical protein [Verrucomicrobiae bacterium]